MSAVSIALEPTPLTAEIERVELLAHCLGQLRQGQDIAAETLERLRQLQSQVEASRHHGGIWRALGATPLSAMECDVLACVVAPEVEPRIGWLFQNLQPGTPQPYPTPALIQELLALPPDDANTLYTILAEDSTLVRAQLVQREGEDPYQPLRAGRGVIARLLGRRQSIVAPPGSTRIPVTAQWDDLILPPDRLQMLREFLWWIQYRDQVVNEWGGASVGGPVALFAGPSGTGKTFAASVLAGELGWPLFRVDLGRLVSKYIGETEKNLNRLFDAAHGRDMVLQFDEADALFAKRGEVKEARDRYANMEVSHLLARVESHQGPCILTSNLRRNIDPAFARRFQVVVDFPRPDVNARAHLWAHLLPRNAPRDASVTSEFLGESVTLTGGGIRNAALHAAYLAAGTGQPISLAHIATAVWRELAKDGREVTRSDLGPLASYLPKEVTC